MLRKWWIHIKCALLATHTSTGEAYPELFITRHCQSCHEFLFTGALVKRGGK